MEVSEQTFRRFPGIPRNSTAVDYQQSFASEEFLVARPSDFDPRKTYGLIVYISPEDQATLPLLWSPVLLERDLLMVTVKRAGNHQDPRRRRGLAVAAAYAMLSEYNIDRNRVYAAGLSGGARIASNVAFYHPEIFRGAILSVGADFLRPVEQVKAEPLAGDQGYPYGVMSSSDGVNVPRVKRNVRFVIITGAKDFRYANLLDIYHGGYLADGYRATFLDVPNMGHTIAPPGALGEALRYIEQR